MKLGFVSLGCPKNLVDGEVMLGLAREAGHWGRFDAGLLAHWPDAEIEYHELAGNGARWRETSPLDTARMAAELRARVWAGSRRAPVLIAISLGAMVCLDWRGRWPGGAATSPRLPRTAG